MRPRLSAHLPLHIVSPANTGQAQPFRYYLLVRLLSVDMIPYHNLSLVATELYSLPIHSVSASCAALLGLYVYLDILVV